MPALQQFFEALPATTGAAYVVVSHLSPEHPSNLDEVLQLATSMPVVRIEAGISLEPCHVYVTTPSCVAELIGNEITVTGTNDVRVVSTAIDIFFRSLAEAHRERAVAIILSGAGSDGSVGIKRVKEMGGVTIAQCPDQAEHGLMPRAAIATGMVDFTLGVSDMPQRLLDLWSHAKRMSVDDASAGAQSDDGGSLSDLFSERHQRALREIMIVLRTRTGHDFTRYKRASILRRVERRIHILGLADIEQYRDVLHLNREETTELLNDILVSATNFFRDPDSYDVLRKEILPQLFSRSSTDEPVRVWAPGCATGEEAYTLTMLLTEASSNTRERVPFQVFATDIDDHAIDVARQGLYSDAILADVDDERIKRFFVKSGPDYRIKKEVRERTLFAVHNLLRDPPFSRLDLICCRNVLIHLEQSAQADVLHAFHFALRANGFLFLGAAETIDAASPLFSVVDKKARIFTCRQIDRLGTGAPRSASTFGAGAGSTPPLLPAQPARDKRRLSFGDLHGRLVEECALPSVLVNRDSEIVHVSDRAGRFLQFAGGEPSHNLFAAIRPDLRVELRTALYQALNTQRRIDARPVRVEHDGRAFNVRMIARPLHDDEANDDFVLILFDETPETTNAVVAERADEHHVAVIAQLEQELQGMRAKLQQMKAEYDASSEELRASNEELLATNDELRAAAETLEASQENLHSVNEALASANDELNTKVTQTTKLNDDLHNLIAVSDTGTVFIDRKLRVMRFTPRTKEIFDIAESDIGRSLLQIPHRLQYDKLEDDAAEAVDSLKLTEREIRGADGRWYLARFIPYRATGEFIEGAVVSFMDITTRRLAEERLHSASQMALEEVKHLQDEFLAVVSHELKHPLNLITANAELIARSPWVRREPSLAHATSMIARTVMGQAQIIDDLLDISRVRTGKLSIARAAADLTEIVRRICGTVREEARRSEINLIVSVPDHPVTIAADITRIEQVLWNLLGNALKYTNRNGTITVTLAADDAFVKLTVGDDGIGIDPTVLPYIFEMFQRGQTTGSEGTGGLGIGLSLVKELVALHGGRVSVQSDGLGQGSIFTVEFPRLLEEASAVPEGGHPAAFLRDTEVVLVDDDRDTVEAFKLLLEMEGADVIVATGGVEALRILDNRCPAFILSDLGMPGMTGVELIEAVRKRNRLAQVKAIALSGFGRDSDIQAALRAGFDAHLTKPVTLDALLDTMARLRAR